MPFSALPPELRQRILLIVLEELYENSSILSLRGCIVLTCKLALVNRAFKNDVADVLEFRDAQGRQLIDMLNRGKVPVFELEEAVRKFLPKLSESDHAMVLAVFHQNGLLETLNRLRRLDRLPEIRRQAWVFPSEAP